MSLNEVGVVGFEGTRELVRNLGDLVTRLSTVEGCVQVDAFASARDGQRVEAHIRENCAGGAGNLGALLKPGARPGIEVEHEPVGVLAESRASELPLRNVNFQRSDLAQPGECGEVVHERVIVGVIFVFDAATSDPLRCRAVIEVLLKEHLAGCILGADSVNPTLAGRGAVHGVGQERCRDAGVVVDDVGLGRARLGVEHLVEIGQLETVTIDRDVLLIHCHGSILMSKGVTEQGLAVST